MAEPTDTDKGCYTDHGVSGYGVAVKLSRREPMDEAWVKAMAEEMMLRVADKCLEQGARCIGHVKSHVRTEAGCVMADTLGTGHGAYSWGGLKRPVQDLFMAVNCIVQGIPEDQVKVATLAGIHEVAARRGLLVVKEKEHTYFDQFDFVRSEEESLQELEKQFGAAGPEDRERGGDEAGGRGRDPR